MCPLVGRLDEELERSPGRDSRKGSSKQAGETSAHQLHPAVWVTQIKQIQPQVRKEELEGAETGLAVRTQAKARLKFSHIK